MIFFTIFSGAFWWWVAYLSYNVVDNHVTNEQNGYMFYASWKIKTAVNIYNALARLTEEK